MREEWRPVPGYEMAYAVSSHGNVRGVYREIPRATSPMRKGARTLRQTRGARGYLTVTLALHGKRKNFYVHRLVADAFVERPDGANFVWHRNGTRTDNRSENLEWVTERGIPRRQLPRKTELPSRPANRNGGMDLSTG